MKLAIDNVQRQYFRKNHAIEFELLSPLQLDELNHGIEQALGPSAGESADKTFAAGRDLWRRNELVKKYVTNRSLAEIASELIEYKPLRLAFDQFYPSLSKTSPFLQKGLYKQFLQQPRSLKEISSIQGLLCGLVICLSGEPGEENKPVTIFPSIPGNGTFFSVDAVLDFQELLQEQAHRYLMVAYTHATSIYVLEENDPQTHELKRLGYVFGDKLSDRDHPLVYR